MTVLSPARERSSRTTAASDGAASRRSAKSPADAVLLVDRHTLPQSIAVTQTRALPLGIEVAVADLAHYERVMFQTLLKLPNVADVRSNFALRTVKAPGPLPV